MSVSGLCKIRFNAYTLHQISTKNQFPKKPGLPLSTIIILDWYPYLYLFRDLLCNIGFLASCGSQISYLWRNAHWGLWVEPTRSWKLLVPSIPVKLSHIMDMLNSDTTFNWTCIISLYQHFIPKKTQRCKSLFFTHFPTYMKIMFSLRSSSYDLRSNYILSLSKPKTTTCGLNSFSYFSAKQWNALPDFFHTSFFADFKTKIQDVTFM